MAGKFGPQSMQTSRLSGMQIQQALLGACVPVLFGTRRVSWNLIWYGDFTSAVAQQASGGGGGGSGGVLGKGGSNSYVYSASVLGLLSEGPVMGVDSVWDQNGMYQVQSATETFNVPGTGPYIYTAQNNGAAIFNNNYGVSQPLPYSVNTNDYGSPTGPGVLSGTQNIPLNKAVGSPGVGEYSVSSLGVYSFNAAQAGAQMQATYSYYRYQLTQRELAVVPIGGGIVTVEYQPEFTGDVGVQYYPSGVALTPIFGGSPSVGQYNPNNGNYEFSAADGGQEIVINYSWNNPSIDQNAPNTLNLTIIEGTPGQAPWTYLTSSYPGQALGYSGCSLLGSASLYLGYAPNLPNYSYEVGAPFAFGGGNKDCCPADVIEQILANPIFGVGMDPKWIDTSLQGLARAYWLANNFFISEYLTTQAPTASVIGKYLEASMVAAFWSEGVLKFVPAGTASAVANGATYTPPTNPIVTFKDSDYITEKGKDPVTFSRVPWQNAYNDVRIEWSPRENSYNKDILEAMDEASIDRFGFRQEGPKAYPFLCVQDAAQYAANMRLQRFQGIKNTYQFTVKSVYDYLEPMDVVQITDPKLVGVKQLLPVRLTKCVYDQRKGIACNAEDVPFAVFNTPLYGKAAWAPSDNATISRSQPNDTELLVIEIPASLNPPNAAGNTLYVFATGQGTNWGGCSLLYSYDNITYNLLATIRVPGKIGVLASILPSNSSPDTTNTLKVNMTNTGAVLQSVSLTAVNGLATLSALIDSSGNLELIAYETAALSGKAQYSLTHLLRGQLGTIPRTFAAGSDFARLDEASAEFHYAQNYVGTTIYFKALSFNQYGMQQQQQGDVTPVTITLSGTQAVVAGDVAGVSLTTSTPLNTQASINPVATDVTASMVSDAAPKIDITVNAGTIYNPDGSSIAVPGSTPTYTTWNSAAVAYPSTPLSGTSYSHYGGNIVWNVPGAAIVVQEYGPVTNTTPVNPWGSAQGAQVLADGYVWLLAEADAWFATDHTGAHTTGGSTGISCPLEGTEIIPLGSSPALGVPFVAYNWVDIELEDGKKLIATPKHPVYKNLGGKTALEAVEVGDELITRDGMSKVKTKRFVGFEGKAVKVTMPVGHLYWANGILSHNVKTGL